MSRYSSLILAGAAMALILALWGCHPAQTSAAGETRSDGMRLVRLPDGRHLAMRCTGQGSPTVLLESGYAGSSLGWGKVQPAVALTTRVCAYDRAGYGLSDPGPPPRDGAAVVRDLDKALKAAGISGPFVLVGHSAGGLYVRLFAARRLGEVAGMVLVDPSFEHQDQHFAALLGPGAGSLAPQRANAARCLRASEATGPAREFPEFDGCFPKNGQPIAPPSFWRTEMSEAETLWGSTSDEVDRIGDLLRDVPVIVLTAQKTYAATPEPYRTQLTALWAGLHRELAAKSVDGVERGVDSGHLIMVERPDVVVAAIQEMVDKARKRGPAAKSP
jgi:pimeloyl-ACP methyl ester carboxylesterase